MTRSSSGTQRGFRDSVVARFRRFSVVMPVVLAVLVFGGAGCLPQDPSELPVPTGRFAGQVVISGGVGGARVTIDQLDLETGEVRFRVGETVSDEMGRFSIETGTENGLFLVQSFGGTYHDLATGAMIQLDDTDEIRSLVRHELLDLQEDALVSPIGHMIEARTTARLAVLGNLQDAYDETTAVLGRHFGNVSWGEVALWPLEKRAISPIEPVRAAFVHAALSMLAHDIAADAEVGPQDVNVYKLMLQWTDDIRTGTFDGNDGDDRAPGSGLQLGYCRSVDSMCVVPTTGCTVGYCRRLCDLYSGTARALLAGAMTKVILDDGPSGLNGTGLDLPNMVSVVRDVSDNKDPELFNGACLEDLDRLPPMLRFDPPTPGQASFVRGQIDLKASAVDDTDPRPGVSIVGVMDEDGDPSNAVAIGRLDTGLLADGAFTVTARTTDRAGNTATLDRLLTIDNTAPVLALDAAGFFVDGATWWTASDAPLLTGTIGDAAPIAIKAVIPGGPEVAGVVTGASWTVQLPAGALDAGGTTVQIVAVDAAGNQTTVTRRLRPDVEPPVLSFQPSTVNDEAGEAVTFTADHNPQHVHAGAPIDLTPTGSCPSLTKFSYLLGSAAPEYAIEIPVRNPIRYQLVTEDPGVGIAAGSTQYRVGRRVGTSTTWILDWTPAGAGIPIGGSVTQFPIGIFSDVVAGLAATEGVYDVEFRATDRLSRTTPPPVRCFDLHLRAPPLEFETVPSGARPTKDHKYSLDSLSLAPGAPFDEIAARLLNDDATGASLIDQDVFNGTAETVYLTVTVTKPTAVIASQSFVLDNAVTNVSSCTGAACGGDAVLGTSYLSPTPPPAFPQTNLHFPVKVFEVVGGVPTTEIPCLAPCPPFGSEFKFAIPPRTPGIQPARLFRVMTMIGQVSALWPRDLVYDAIPPFADDTIVWTDPATNVTTSTRLTGIVDRSVVPERTGCVHHLGATCDKRGTFVPYRALRSAALTFATATTSQYATAATAALPPVPAALPKSRSTDPINNWSTSEGLLP